MRLHELLYEQELSPREQMALGVYNAFRNAGFSDPQSRALTAEVNRENSFRPNYIYGTHSDPANRATNVGLISWQGPRRTEFMNYMQDQGLLDDNGRIIPGQDTLNAQARFLRREMETGSAGGTRNQISRYQNWLETPDVDPSTSRDVLGGDFIRWRLNDPRYRAGGLRNIRDGYATLSSALRQAPNASGVASTRSAPATTPSTPMTTTVSTKTPSSLPSPRISLPNVTNLTSPTTATTPTRPSLDISSLPSPGTQNFNLRRGSQGSSVSDLQSNLSSLGFNVGRHGVDGMYGPDTASAVRNFQRSYGLQVDGIAGDQTMSALNRIRTATPDTNTR